MGSVISRRSKSEIRKTTNTEVLSCDDIYECLEKLRLNQFIDNEDIFNISLIPYIGCVPWKTVMKSLGDSEECKCLRIIMLILDNLYEDWTYRKDVFLLIMQYAHLSKEQFKNAFIDVNALIDAYTLIRRLHIEGIYKSLQFIPIQLAQFNSCALDVRMYDELM